jgi:hypothetical protein
MAEVGFSKTVALVATFVGLLVLASLVPTAIEYIINITTGMTSLPMGSITSLITGLLVGFIIAFGVVKVVAEAFGIEIRF